jgi:hypothetical protein
VFDKVPLGTDYVVMDFADKSLFDFSVATQFASGEEDLFTASRSTRGTNSGRFFLELAQSPSTVSSLLLTLPQVISGNLQVTFCTYPLDGDS